MTSFRDTKENLGVWNTGTFQGPRLVIYPFTGLHGRLTGFRPVIDHVLLSLGPGLLSLGPGILSLGPGLLNSVPVLLNYGRFLGPP